MKYTTNTKFSIITVTYNRKDGIQQTIRSVMHQSYPRWELVVVDDGSTDNTPRVVSGIKDGRITYIQLEENRGPSFARNREIDAATGDYIFFLDSDDQLMPHTLENTHQVITEMGERYNEYDFMVINLNSGTPYNRDLPPDRTEITYADSLSGNYDGDYCHVTERTAFARIRFPEHIRGGESVLWHHILRDYGPAFFVRTAVKKVDRDSYNTLSTEIGAASWNAWNNMRLRSRDYLRQFGEDLARVSPRNHMKELQRYAGASLLCGHYEDAIRITDKLLVLQPDLLNYVLSFLAKSRNRVSLMVYHKSKRLLRVLKARFSFLN